MSLLLLFPAAGGGPQNYGYIGTGGDIDGGAAAYLRSVGFTSIGGDIDGGTAAYNRNAGFSSAGGDIDGGAAVVVGTLGRSGGGSPDSILILPKGHVGIKVTDTIYIET